MPGRVASRERIDEQLRNHLRADEDGKEPEVRDHGAERDVQLALDEKNGVKKAKATTRRRFCSSRCSLK
jgi:hypothetical protein